MLLKFLNGNTIQVKMSAISPIDIVSRDNFISFYSTYGTLLLLTSFSEEDDEMPDIKELDELIGDPDLTINFVMAKNGIQIQIISALEKKNLTWKWEEMFDD